MVVRDGRVEETVEEYPTDQPAHRSAIVVDQSSSVRRSQKYVAEVQGPENIQQLIPKTRPVPSTLSRRTALQTLGALSFATAGCLSNDERVRKKPPGSPPLNPRGRWPARRFDAGNTGWNPDGEGLRDGRTYWRLNAGGPASVARGTLFNTFGRNRESIALTYRDPKTASVEKRMDLVRSSVNPPPVVADDHVFVSTYASVFCFDLTSGEQVWREPEMDGTSRPTVSGERVLVTSGGGSHDTTLLSFDTGSGEELWRYDIGRASASTPAVADGRVYACSEGGLLAVDRATGEEVFVVPEVASFRTDPVVDGGAVFAIDDNFAEEPSELVALDATEGTERWRVPVDTRNPPVVTDDAVYAAVQNRTAALDRADGSVKTWSTPQANPVGLVGNVLYATRRGSLYAFDAANELANLWSITTEDVRIQDTEGRRVDHVTPVDNAVYVAARDAFYGVGPSDGS